MSHAWRPITREEWDELVSEQSVELAPGQRAMLDNHRVEPWLAILRRSDMYGDEQVWVIAEREDLVLYFDDVEWGWNWSGVDTGGCILRPGGSQGSLSDALDSVPDHADGASGAA
jgi:hypothetical protein